LADLTGYIGPNVQSFDFVAGVISLLPPDVNTSIGALRDELVGSGWTNPTLPDGDQDGTLATGSLTALSFPAHAEGSDGSGVPDIGGGQFAGTFDGITFKFYDPLAVPPDPDPIEGGVIWVPLSTTALGTLGTFLGLVSDATRWAFGFVSGNAIEATLSVTAHDTGPQGNIDAYTGSWAPGGDYLGGQGPTGGGWNVYSEPAPVTGDTMKLTIFQGEFGSPSPALKFELPSGSGNTTTYALAQLEYNYGFNPYQVAIRCLPGTGGSSVVGTQKVLAAALNVPAVLGPVSINISGVVNTAGSVPVVIETTLPHGRTMQDRIKLAGIAGAAHANGAWWVAKIPTPTSLWISNAPLVFVFGDGNAYTGGGSVYEIGTSAVFAIANVVNDPSGPVVITTVLPNGYQPGDFVSPSGAGGIANLRGVYSVAAVLSPTEFEIAKFDAGILDGDGNAYTGGGTLTSGIFQAMFAAQIDTLFYDDGNTSGSVVAAQGVFGSFTLQQRLYLDGSMELSSLATYSMAIHVPWSGEAGDGETSALKPILVAPYVALRIAAGQETRLAGTLWDSYVELQNYDYGQRATHEGISYMAWVTHEPTLATLNATLFMKSETTSS
jgi:hypothetical protein